MLPPEDPKATATADELDFDATDSGWDPYVAALLAGAGADGDTVAGDEDDSSPVMSITRRRKTPGA